jgi:hypothetical protein
LFFMLFNLSILVIHYSERVSIYSIISAQGSQYARAIRSQWKTVFSAAL